MFLNYYIASTFTIIEYTILIFISMRNLIIVLILISSINIYSQDISKFGTSLIENYTTDDYNSMSKNWRITQAENGLIYVANNSALLEYDGERWNKYVNENMQIYFSVKAIGNKIFVGLDGDFGYWQYNEKGDFVYKSLYPKEEEKDHKYEEFWNILESSGLIYFQSNDNIYIYKNDVLTRISAPYKFNSSYLVNGKIYIEDNKYGLFKLKSNRLENVIEGELFSNASICGVTQLENQNTLLIVTKHHGIFILKDGVASEYKTESSEFLKKNMVFSFKRFNNKYLAFGTVLDGLLITDLQGNPIQHINKLGGLQNNTVLGINYDRDNNLWLALNNGVSCIKLNSPITQYTDYLGKLGTIYTSIASNNKLYVGTNQGLYYKDLSLFKNSVFEHGFKLVKGTVGQVWKLKLVDDVLICGHNKGTFIINDTVMQKVSLIRGGWNYKEIPNNDIFIIGGNYDGLELFSKSGSSITSLGLIKNFSETSRFLEFDKFGYLWISHTYKGIYRLKLNDDYSRVVEEIFFDIGDFTNNNRTSIYMFKHNEEVYFSDGLTLYEYNLINKTIEETDDLKIEKSQFYKAKRVFDFNDFQVLTDDNKLTIYKKNYIKNDSILGYIYQGTSTTMGNNFENVNQVAKNFIVSGKVDGFTIFNATIPKFKYKNLDDGPLVREIFVIDENNNRKNIIRDNLNNIEYNERFLNFRFAYPSFDDKQVYNFQLIKDNITIRTETNNNGKFVFRNNNYGNFKLIVDTKLSGNNFSNLTVVDFRINRPILLSNIFIAIYIIFLIIIFLILRFLYKKRLKKHRKDLETSKKLALKSQEDEFKRNDIEQQKIINDLEKQQLESEISSKSYQLANIAKHTSNRNEILETVKDKILSINERSSIKMPKKYIKEIQNYLQSFIDESETETMFEENFKAVNQSFYKKLINLFPDLSPSDLKLAAFLKMNLSTKEIAELLNITSKSLEVSRYRLRKKLKLERSDNLISFLLNI